MSYLKELDVTGLPSIRKTEETRRRVAALEDELYRSSSPTGGILKYETSGQSRRVINEMQDQLRSFREELKKKDALIQHLVSLDAAHRVPRPPDSVRFDSFLTADRQALDTARSDMAALQVKYDKHLLQVKDMENELHLKEVKVRELQAALQSSRDNEVRLTEMVQSLRDRIHDLEHRTGSYETVAERGEYTISTLQNENRDQQNRIVELESRLRAQLEEREAAEAKGRSAEARLDDLVAQLSSILRADTFDQPASVDTIVRKMTDLIQENAMLRGKILTLNETLNNTETETKASRETIMRLVSEVGREQKVATRYTADIENLRVERDNALAAKHDLEREVDLMRERLEASQKALDAANAELRLHEGRYSHLDREVREKAHSVHATSSQFALFKEQLVGLLSSANCPVDSSEEGIRNALHRVVQDNRELVLRVEALDGQCKNLGEQLENQLEIQRDAVQRAKRFETEAYDMEQRLRTIEGELSAGDALRDGFKIDKEKYLRGLQRLGETMKMDRISLDLGLDMTLDALVARGEQLVRLETNALAERSTHVYNLQRKVKSMREQLESKDLHIDLLRKKMSALEERVHGRTEVERERDSESVRVRKLEKALDKYKMQVQDLRHENQNLKAQLLGASDLKLRTVEQRKDLEELAKQVEELEAIRRKQSAKISSLRGEIGTQQSELQEKRVVSDNAVQALSSELRTTKNALEVTQHREKQLVDFRTVVARMLGLDVNTLAVPDYEVISRLEKLIRSHHTQAFTTLSLEEALADVEDGFLSDYDKNRRAVQTADPVIKQSRERSRRKAARARARARSASPVRRDPRSY